MSGSAGGKRETQNSQTGVDPTTYGRMNQMWQAAQAAGAAGPSPLLGGAAGYNTGLQNAGTTGVNALNGNPVALGQLMDPYQHQVVDATNAQYDHSNAMAQRNVNDQATMAGAFGGSRHGVAEGVAVAENERNRNSAVSGLLSSGYENAMGRAQGMAGMGFAGAGANANLGMAGVGSPMQWYMNMLNQGYHGPTGTTSSGAQAETQGGFGFKIPFLS